jgi:hypothetical protein
VCSSCWAMAYVAAPNRERKIDVDSSKHQLLSRRRSIGGALADGHSRGLPRTDALLPSTKRYEVQTRFWLTPGAAALSVEASKLSTTWTVLVDNYESEDDWKDAYTAHIQALRRFESAVRRHMGDTTPSRTDGGQQAPEGPQARGDLAACSGGSNAQRQISESAWRCLDPPILGIGARPRWTVMHGGAYIPHCTRRTHRHAHRRLRR